MKSWSVRSRIIGGFAAVIAIMIALSGLSFVGLRAIRRQATQIEKDVFPGVLISARSQALARELQLAITSHAAASTVQERRIAVDSIEQLLRTAAEVDEAYRATIVEESDRQLFDAMRASREKFVAAYRDASTDGVLTDVELRSHLRPPLQDYIRLSDSLFELNRKQGAAATTTIAETTNRSYWALGPALLLAIFIAAMFSALLVTDVSRLIGQVQKSGVQVNSSVTEISATSKQQQATVTEIAATTAEVGATASRISLTSKELARTMADLSEVSDQTSALAQGGHGGLLRMESTMGRIGAASDLINSRLALLSEKATNIGMVVTTISKVADQTNLLSLNAAIEAEKAGEHGRGFAVVAREIRRLADQTAIATSDIEQIVKEMQSAVSAGVMGIDKFADEVRRGRESISEVTAQLTEIIGQVQLLPPSFESVNEGVQSQSISAAQISEALAQLSMASQQTADSLRQSSMAIDQLHEASRGLQSGVERFSPAT
ncbi:MAG: methyl-accepting chemotaxis protein [Gemmatimonadaceae bacterium]